MFKITNGENLRLWRTRQRLTQGALAKRWGVSWRTIAMYEQDKLALPRKIKSVTPTMNERCVLLRLRNSLTQRNVADRLGCTRLWVNRMERGLAPCRQLVEFWMRHGV